VDADLADIGAQYIGKLYAHAPIDETDGAWPTVQLRELIEEVALDDFERGIFMERFSMRGAYVKGMYDGGREERGFASQNRSWALVCASWPRTSALLNRVADDWDEWAEREDIEARQREMRD
jgi:hypothetical protein